MRTPKYISPTSYTKFYADRDEFYLSYLADNRPARFPQTQPMSVGSAFDAYAKCSLHRNLFGNEGPDFEHRIDDKIVHGPMFNFDLLFQSQVEKQNREWAREHGKHVFDSYNVSGALADLMIELEQADGEVNFELTVEGNPFNVPLLGKPDIDLMINGTKRVLDWKVNGYCSKRPTSPKKGYIIIRDGYRSDYAPPSRGVRLPHKDAVVINGINTAHYMEDIDKTWATQLSMYTWLLGEIVGTEFVVGIEQITGKGQHESGFPLLRVSSHRLLIGRDFQITLRDKLVAMWRIIESGHIFDNLTREESDARCLLLDDQHKAFTDDKNGKWLQDTLRQHKF